MGLCIEMAGKADGRGRPRKYRRTGEAGLEYRKKLRASGYVAVSVFLPSHAKAVLDALCKETEKTQSEVLSALIEEARETHERNFVMEASGFVPLNLHITKQTQELLASLTEKSKQNATLVISSLLKYASEHSEIFSELFPQD